MSPLLLQVGVEVLPSVIGLIQSAFARRHPDQPVPTGAEILALFDQTFLKSVAIDDAILSAPPPPA